MLFGKYTAVSRNKECVEDEILFEDTIIKNKYNGGFNWGYTGGGPMDLSIAILDHFNKVNHTTLNINTNTEDTLSYSNFEKEVIATQDPDKDLCITTCDILE